MKTYLSTDTVLESSVELVVPMKLDTHTRRLRKLSGRNTRPRLCHFGRGRREEPAFKAGPLAVNPTVYAWEQNPQVHIPEIRSFRLMYLSQRLLVCLDTSCAHLFMEVATMQVKAGTWFCKKGSLA